MYNTLYTKDAGYSGNPGHQLSWIRKSADTTSGCLHLRNFPTIQGFLPNIGLRFYHVCLKRRLPMFVDPSCMQKMSLVLNFRIIHTYYTIEIDCFSLNAIYM